MITTRRLIFDELTVGRDEPFIFQLLNQRGFIDNIGDRGITDLQAASAYIQDGQLRSYRENGFGLWRVCSRDSGQALGLCGLVRRAGLAVPDVGYAFLEGVWGQGLAQEAAAAQASATAAGVSEAHAAEDEPHCVVLGICAECVEAARDAGVHVLGC